MEIVERLEKISVTVVFTKTVFQILMVNSKENKQHVTYSEN